MVLEAVSNMVPEFSSGANVTGAIANGGTMSDSGIAQGNVGATQSGPNAASMPDGTKMPRQSVEKSLRHTAQKNLLRL
jgi:hypothetical protein